MIFMVLWLFVKVFSAKFGVWRLLAWQKRAIHKHFVHKNRIFHESFLPQKFPTIGIHTYIATV